MDKHDIPSSPSNIPSNELINEKDMLEEFTQLFQSGRTFASRAILRSEIEKYGQKYNVVMSTKNSNYKSVHLWCKHAGVYKKGKTRTKDSDRVVKQRKKNTNRSGCGCYIKAKLINELWVIEQSHGEHNHLIPNNRTVYSIHRRQTKEIQNLILQLLNDGQKISSILEYLGMLGINNIIKKDIENLQQKYKRKEKQKLIKEKTSMMESLPIIIPSNDDSSTPSLLDHQSKPFDLLSHESDNDNQMLYPSTTTTTIIPILHYTNSNTHPSSILATVKDANTSMLAHNTVDIVESIQISNKQ